MSRRREVPGKLSIERARRAQLLLATMVVERDEFRNPPEVVAGVDVSYAGNKAVGAVVFVDYRTLELIKYSTVVVDIKFPYVPTLLAFREFYPMAKAIVSAREVADIYMIDAQGRLHPYGLGAASHVGVVLDIATIGVAKRLLCGKVRERTNDVAYVEFDNKIVGAALWTRRSSKPIYVSVGNKVSLETAIKIVKHTTAKGRKLPEPIRLAHAVATKKRNSLARR